MGNFDNTDDIDDVARSRISSISERLIKHFDVSYDVEKCGNFFHLYAYHKNDFYKSFLTKSTVYEGFSIFEHVLLRVYDKFEMSDFEDFRDTLIDITPELVSANKLHKKSIVTGIAIIKPELDDNISKSVRKFFFRKTYKCCFHGWSETQMAVFSSDMNKSYLPKNNKDIKKLFVDI